MAYVMRREVLFHAMKLGVKMAGHAAQHSLALVMLVIKSCAQLAVDKVILLKAVKVALKKSVTERVVRRSVQVTCIQVFPNEVRRNTRSEDLLLPSLRKRAILFSDTSPSPNAHATSSTPSHVRQHADEIIDLTGGYHVLGGTRQYPTWTTVYPTGEKGVSATAQNIGGGAVDVEESEYDYGTSPLSSYVENSFEACRSVAQSPQCL